MDDANFGYYLDKTLGLDYARSGRLDNNCRNETDKPDKRVDSKLKAARCDAQAQEMRIERQRRLITARQGSPLRVSTKFGAVTGTGRNSPLMTGFQTDWLSGWPVFPASGLKGMTRAWVENWADEAELGRDWEEIYGLSFGQGPMSGQSGYIGEMLFLDGLIAPLNGKMPVSLDVITPHNGAGGFDPEKLADWADPTPLPFLIVSQNAVLHTGVIPRDPLYADVSQRVCEWMKQAFAELGAGGRTRIGLGRFLSE